MNNAKKYDTIITKRTLINLGNFNNQKDSILKIHNALTKNGYYIMLECSLDGLESMNSIRKSFSLDSIKMPYHNFHFNMNELLSFLNKYFEVSYKQYFSDYFYLTRIIGHLISNKTLSLPLIHQHLEKAAL